MKGETNTLMKKAQWLLTRVWVWLPVVLGMLFVVALILLPFAIRQGAERWLTDQGAEQARIEDVDFNFFLGQLTVRNLQFKTGGERSLVVPHASLRFALLPLLQRQMVIHEIYLRDTSLTVELTAEGNWRIAGLGKPAAATTSKPAPWHVDLQNVKITNSELKYTSPALSGLAEIELGEVALNSTDSVDAAISITSLQARLNGKLLIARAKPDVTIEFRINADVTAKAPELNASGPWHISGNGELRQLDVRWKDGNLRVVSAEQVKLEELSMTGLQQIAIRTAGIEGFVLAQPTAQDVSRPFLKASQLRARGLSYLAGQSLAIEEISAHGFNLVAAHEKRGSWYGLTPLRAFLRAIEPPGPKKPALPLRIGTIAIQEPGLIELSDNAIKPAFQSRLSLTSAMLTGVDTNTAPKSPTNVAIKTRIGKYAAAELHGQILTYRPKMAASLLFKWREFELPTLSSYSARMLGYRAVSGQMSGELDLQIADGRLDGKSKLLFAKLAMKPIDDASVEQLKDQISVPLETGLNMLRDKNGKVNLEVDISGDIGDPKFDLTNAINQALTKAMRTASVSYLKYYFQPFGTLIMVAELAGKTMQLRLDPVTYAPGAVTPEPGAQDYLAKIGKLLQEREKLGIKLCGKSASMDAVTEEAARALATRRAERLKDILVNEYGIASDRLFLCEPELDKDAAARPRVELLL